MILVRFTDKFAAYTLDTIMYLVSEAKGPNSTKCSRLPKKNIF